MDAGSERFKSPGGKHHSAQQFHLEADARMINGWFASEKDTGRVISPIISEQETSEKSADCLKWGKKLLTNFFALAQET